ncbi:MAG: protein kinase domain-containing protein, partial [Rubripirellula sp.]
MSDELVGSMVVISGPEKGRSFSIATGVCVVGRGRDSDTQIRDPKISRIHCEIRALQGRLELVHRGGSGGTLVDGVAIKGSVQLSTGSVLQLGDTILRIDSADPLDAATVASNQTALPASSCAEADNVAEAGVVPFDVVTPTVKAGAPSIRLEALVGQKINDFRLDRVASVGRNSVVFKAHDVENDAPVAMKILKPQLTSTDVQRERFIRAMQTMKQVRHQNIVRLKRAGKKGPYCWTALEWVEGVSVKELIDAIGISGMLDWKEVWRIAVHIGQALQKAHEIDIVHRNVSPSNILRRAESQDFLLTDLVLARALENTDHVQLTRPGDLLGELGYMAPERVFDS